MKKFSILFVIIVFIFGCADSNIPIDEGDELPIKSPGKFSATVMSGNVKLTDRGLLRCL